MSISLLFKGERVVATNVGDSTEVFSGATFDYFVDYSPDQTI